MSATAPQKKPSPPSSPLARPVTTLFGVGPERAAQLAKLEVATIEDLLLLRPNRYEDRKNLRKISELRLAEAAIAHGKIVAMGTRWFKQHTKSIVEIVLDDGSGRLYCRWWNLPFMEKYFAMGDEVLVFGKPIRLKPRTIDHPETEILEGGEEKFIQLWQNIRMYDFLVAMFASLDGQEQGLVNSKVAACATKDFVHGVCVNEFEAVAKSASLASRRKNHHRSGRKREVQLQNLTQGRFKGQHRCDS